MFEFLKKPLKGKKTIKFGRTVEFIDYPVPAVTQIPEWYKAAPRLTFGSEPKIQNDEQKGNLGVKYCMPFLDSMSTGYMALLWQDMVIEQTASGPKFTWAVDPQIVDGREMDGMETLPVPFAHNPKQFIWRQPFSVLVPEGYSVLYTHPLNRYDLPFVTLTGIHDSDSLMPPGNFPFYLRDGFEGLIPKGTPLFQIIPFKREEWVGVGSKEISDKAQTRGTKSVTMLSGYYKKYFWHRKSYVMGEEE